MLLLLGLKFLELSFEEGDFLLLCNDSFLKEALFVDQICYFGVVYELFTVTNLETAVNLGCVQSLVLVAWTVLDTTYWLLRVCVVAVFNFLEARFGYVWKLAWIVTVGEFLDRNVFVVDWIERDRFYYLLALEFYYFVRFFEQFLLQFLDYSLQSLGTVFYVHFELIFYAFRSLSEFQSRNGLFTRTTMRRTSYNQGSSIVSA